MRVARARSCATFSLGAAVYGFDIPGQPLDTPTFTAAERGWPQYSLPVRMIKGSVGSGLDINAEVQPGGTAG